MFRLDNFVKEKVIQRENSLFVQDIEENKEKIRSAIWNRSVLVIGGAGSIGSSFIYEILPFQPSELVVVDLNENALTELTRGLRSTREISVPEKYATYPMDYASPVFKKMFCAHRGFDIVANFSAHKHVRSERDIYSVEVLLQNNILHVKGLLDLLAEFPPLEYFCVSTDKAANPVNIMGASKRIMEDLVFSYADRFLVKTARFANVAFSNGSLPAGFLERIAKQQPISAPRDVKRYFVSQEESGQICMLACTLGQNCEIFFPKLEESGMMSFDKIAAELLRELGYEVLECGTDEEALEKIEGIRRGGKYYPVHFSLSDTTGEKQYEEFHTESESIELDRFTSLGVIVGKASDSSRVEEFCAGLDHLFHQDKVGKQDIVSAIKQYLPNFEHLETGKSLDEKM